MEINIKKIKKIILGNQTNFSILILSLLTIIFGSLAIGFLKALLIVSGITLTLFIINVLMTGKYKIKLPKFKLFKNKNSKSKSKNNVKDSKNHKNSIVNNYKKISSNTKKKKEKNIKTSKNTDSKKKKTLKTILLIVLSFGIITILSISLFVFIIIKEAPTFDPNNLYNKEATIIYDSQGNIIAKLGEELREKITFDEIPEVLVNAIIATEDARFFQHNGFDLPRFLKASFGQLLGNSGAGGASTLTMQVVKNNVTNEKYNMEDSGIKGIMRKFTDIYMSIFKIEKNYTKEQIFEFYVNAYNMGAGAFGIEQACQTYFGKSAKDINLAESAMIAGLFQAPSAYNPFLYPEATESRRQTVLYLMERHGYINSEQRKIASDLTVDKLIVEKKSSKTIYQSFIDTVVREVIEVTKKDPYDVSMEIYTTMDKEKQDHVNKVMNGEESIYKWENDVVDAGISVIDVNTGAIVAIGGGRKNSGELVYNFATMTKRQIGSTAKPLYDYGPGIEYNNWSTYTTFVDEPHSYTNGSEIGNWNLKFNGLVTMRQAIISSMNIPALKAFQSVENKNVKQFVTGLGLSPEIESGLIHEAHSLGGYNGESPLTLSSAYAAIANGGYYIKPYSFKKIVYRENGETYDNTSAKKRAMSEETSYMLANVLVDTAKTALGKYSTINGVTYGAKTGTTNFSKETFDQYKFPSTAVNDTWVAGISPNYSIAVWYGYDVIHKDYYNKISSGQNSRIFQAVAKGIFEKNTTFKKPNGVVEVKVEKDNVTAMLPSEFTPANMIITELFKKGTEPTEVSDRYSRLNDVTNLDFKIKGNKVTLSWDALETPKAIDNNYLSTYFNKIYKRQSDATNYLNARIKYNNENIGTIVYNVYNKSSNGNLTLIGTTANTSIDQTIISTANPITYVVKSSYSIFKSNESAGSEITAKFDDSSSIITSELNGNDTLNLSIGSVYTEPNPSVIVLENLNNVTNDVNITRTIKRTSDNTVVSTIDPTKAETFIITYNITYKNYNSSLTRKIIYK